MVRFAKWEEISTEHLRDTKKWSKVLKNHVGILIKHDKVMQMTEILYEGEVLRVRSQFAEKAGKKDIEKYKKSNL